MASKKKKKNTVDFTRAENSILNPTMQVADSAKDFVLKQTAKMALNKQMPSTNTQELAPAKAQPTVNNKLGSKTSGTRDLSEVNIYNRQNASSPIAPVKKYTNTKTTIESPTDILQQQRDIQLQQQQRQSKINKTILENYGNQNIMQTTGKQALQAGKELKTLATDKNYRNARLEQMMFTGKQGMTVWDQLILPTANTFNIAAKTVVSQAESGIKFLYNESTKATNWLNNQLGLMSDKQYQKAEEFRKNFMKENTTEKIWRDTFGWNDEVTNYVNENSFVTEDNFLGKTVQGLTQLMTTAAMGQTGFGWELPTFISSAGGAEQKAYQLGANDTQALAVGLIGGTLEVLTEKLGSGVVKVKGTGWKSFEKLEDELTNKISDNVLRYLAQTGVSAMNEGLEEVISGFGNALAEKLTYMNDKELSELYSSKDAFQDFAMATWTSLLAGGARATTPSGGQQLREDIKSGRSQITGFTQNEQKIIDSEVAQRIQEAKEKGQKVKTGEIVEQVQEDLRNGDLSAESIQRGINGEKYQVFAENETKLKETQSQLEEVEKNLKDNYSSKVSKLNPEYEQLLQQQKDLSEQINVLKNNQQALGRESYLEARELSQNDALAQRSLYEYEQGGRHFEYKLDDNASDRTKGLYESAAQNGNNTTKFRNFVKGLDTLQNSTDKSYQYRFTNTEELREKGLLGKTNYDVQEGDTLESIAKKFNMSVEELQSMNKNLDLTPGNQIKVYAMSNGLKAGNTIYLNIDTNDSLETVLGHEVTHLLEGTDDYKTLRDLLYKQAKKNGIYDTKRAELEELYAAENADIDSELTAELAKELFTDENFINDLTTKPTTFKKVLNFIDDLITKFTGTSEEVELRKIKKQFQEAFNNMKSYDESNKVQHSITKQSKQMLEQEFKNLTGDSLLVAEAKLGNYAFQQIQGREVEAPYNKEAMDIYEEIQNSKKTSSHLYHSTPVDRIQSIIQNGLQVGSKQNQEGISSENKLYLSATEELADSFTPESSVMLRISPNAKLENLDYDLLGGEGSYTITNNIDPKYLQVKENGKWINLLKSSYANKEEQIAPFNNAQYSITRDSKGRELSEGQQEHFKNVSPELVDRDGNLKVMYHGTPNTNFNIFETSRANSGAGLIGLSNKGFYFTDNLEQAETYAIPRGSRAEEGETPGVKEVYLNMKNPLVVDATTKEGLKEIKDTFGIKGNKKITFKNIDNYVNKMLYDDPYNLRSDERRQEYFNNTGYDGVILKHENGNEYVVFNSNQIKNADNTNPTSSPDIRYSISKDNQGRSLTEGQQNFVRNNSQELFDDKGNVKTYYHTTTNEIEPFSVFNPVGTVGYKYDNIVVNFYTDNPIMSGSYADSDYEKYSPNSTKKARYQYEGYISMKNPYVVDSDNRSYGKANIKANESASKTLNILNNLTDDTIKELATVKQEAIEKSRNQERIVNNLEFWEQGFNKEEKVALQIGEILDATEKYNLNEEAQERNNRLIQRILEKEGFTNEWDLDNLKYDYYNKDSGINLKQYGIDRDLITLKDFAEIKNEMQRQNKFAYEIFDEEIEKHRNNPQIAEILDTTFDVKQQTRVLNEETGNKQYGKVSDLVYDAIDPEGKLNRKYLTKEGLQEHYVVDGFINQNTNDVIREVLEMNKNGSNYDGVIFKNLYDYGGSTYDLDSEAGDVVVTFNSNQFKDFRNENPTDDPDINYSMSNNIAPIRQRGLTYDVGVRQEQSPELIDIAPINERIDEARQLRLDYDSEVKALEELDNTIGLDKADSDRLEYLKSLTQTTNESTGQEYTNEYSPFEKAKKNLAENKVKRFIEKETYKAIDKAAKVAAQYGEFNRKEKTNLRNEFKRFGNLTSEQLTNPNTYNEFKDIIRQYADREMNFTDYHLKEVRDDIRKRKINVSDIKNQITDFNDYRRQYFGRLNLTNEGMTIDQHYQELSELYPEYFSKDITTEADMLNQLMDFMDLDTTITEKYRLSDDEIDRITSKAFSTLVTEAPTEQQIEAYEEEINRSVERKRSEVRRQQLLDEMGLTIDDIAVGKDINALGYQRTDPIRLNEKVFGYEVGKKINDATIRQTIHNTAEKMRWQNQERSEIEDLGIKARSKESAAVQKYGEGEYVNDLGELVKYGDKELASEFPNIETQNKIKRAAEVLRGKYDTYIDQINDVLTDLGYDAIPKRKNYFRHFIELNDKFSQWGTPFNRQTMQEQDLPTDINGLTDQFKPGKQYFASALERKGIKTTYDAITGIDGYIETAGNLIFHTEDIQRYRALSKLIRETYGQTHGFDNIDIMTEAEKNQRVEDVYGNKLTKYAAWLDEQANALAGKKAGIDRAVERMLGRKVYTAASTLKSQVGSNMTGFNVRSAMTNFASVVQGASKTSKIALLKGTVSTIQNMIHDDGMTQKSDFLTGRYGTNQLSQKAWQKIANAGQIFMEASDHFTSNQIWRSKYYELLDRGMSETEAIREADDFAARVMGNRVQGATAEIFNSKTLGFLTQFQLEVNNQWSNMIHDNKMDIQSGKKGAASVVFQLGQLYGLSYMFNTIMKGLTGSDVMFDPIDLLMKLFNPDDDDDKTTEERARDVLGDIVNQLPMASIFTGGRIPIQEAFSGVSTGFKYLTGQENEYGQKYTAGDVFDDSLESLAYLLLPTGYGQLRKTYKGTIDTDYDVNLNPFKGEIGITKRPIRGSYTDSGNLRFTADNDIPGRIRSALFGQYANSEAQDYINSGYQTINAKKIPELQEFGMTSSEYKKWQKEYSEATSTTEEIDGVKYTKYKDSDGNIYLYDKNTRTLLDSNGNESNKNVTTMSKVDKKELVYDYIKNSDFTPEQKEYLFDENFDNTTTDKYGYEKYTERTTDKKGKPVTKTYWYDSDTNTLYDSKYKVSNKDINSLTKVSSDKSVEGYNSFDTYEEFDYSYKNPDKYKLIQDTGSYKKYKTNETYQKAVDWAYNTPSNYSMSKALDGIENTYTYLDKLNDIKGDKDKKGKTISGSRKKKVFNYINSLNLTPVQKAMLVRTQYSSYDNYNNEIVNYLNNQTSITLDEEYEILKKLGYKVKGDRVSW